jgi:hypothetical protein
VVPGRVKFTVLVRLLVMIVDRVMLNLVVCFGTVIVRVILKVDRPVVVNPLVKVDVAKEVVPSVAVGSTMVLILPFLLP